MKTTKKALLTAIAAISGSVHASGLEVSNQPITPLFESGNYAEASYVYVKPKITGTDALGQPIGDMLNDYGYASGTLKIAPTPNTALMLAYTQPWGVDTKYPKGNMYNNSLGTTKADVTGKALGLVVGGKVGAQKNIWLYGGVEYQKLSGKVSSASPVGMEAVLQANNIDAATYEALKQGAALGDPTSIGALQALGDAALSPSYYNLTFADSNLLTPMVGVAYEKPEIALRAALTYRAPAEFRVDGIETLETTLAAPQSLTGSTKVKFPQSVSVDFQTGLSQKHQLLGSVNARWVDWSQFEVRPPLANELTGEPLASYAKDQYSVEVALGKQMTPKFAGEVRLGYDSGTGEPLGLLGPYGATKSISIGGSYKVTDGLTWSAGVQYVSLEGGKAYQQDGTPLATLDNGHALAFGTKVGYNF